MVGPTDSRGQDGFVNLNLPRELDLCVDALVSTSIGPLQFSKKKMVWQAALEYWLKMRPDRSIGTQYLQTQATTSRKGSTGFVQRRIELGSDLEMRVRRLATELADNKGRPFPMARIIYTALDYYVRHVAITKATSHTVPNGPHASIHSLPAVADGSTTFSFQMNAGGLDTTRIVQFIERSAPGAATILLTLSMDKAVAKKLLGDLAGNNIDEERSTVGQLIERLEMLAKD